MERIDTEDPVSDVYKIDKGSTAIITILPKITRLSKEKRIIYSRNDRNLDFIKKIYEKQKEYNNIKNQIDIGEKRIGKDALKTLKEKEKAVKKQLNDLETASKTELAKQEMKDQFIEIKNNRNFYEIKLSSDSNKKPIEKEKNVKPVGVLQKESVEKVKVLEPKQDMPKEQEIKSVTKSVPQESKVQPQALPAEYKESKQEILQLYKEELAKSKQESIAQAKPKKKEGVKEELWKAFLALDKQEAYVINGTDKTLYITTEYSGVHEEVQQPSECIIVSDDYCKLKSPPIKYGKWRYLRYTTSASLDKKDWGKKWMWPMQSVYIFDKNEQLHAYNYTARGVKVTADISVEAPLYAAVYFYKKGEAALRTTPVIQIRDPEISVEIPHIVYTPFGNRQLVISSVSSSLKVSLSDTQYSSSGLIKKDITFGIGQKYMEIAYIDKKYQLFSSDEWKVVLQKMAPPRQDLSEKLDWIDRFVITKVKKLAEVN